MRRAALCATLAALSLACSDSDPPTSPQARLAPAIAADHIAHALALALREPEMRTLVRDAMRASPYTEHKLSFQEFTKTAEGTRLVGAAALATGQRIEDLKATIANLPPVDLYVPVKEHRLRWQAEDALLVTSMVTRDVPRGGYGTDGGFREVDFRQSPTHLPTVILLQYRQSKNLRAERQADVAGNVIQEKEDGQISGLVPMQIANGTVVLRQYADLVAERKLRPNFDDLQCEPPGCDPPPPPPGGGGGGWSGSSCGGPCGSLPLAYITQLQTIGVVDNFPGETNEFEFHATSATGQRFDPWPHIEGIDTSEVRSLSIPIMYSPDVVGTLTVIVVETDFLFDDSYVIPGPSSSGCLPAHAITLTGAAGYATFDLYQFGAGGACEAFPNSNTVKATFQW